MAHYCARMLFEFCMRNVRVCVCSMSGDRSKSFRCLLMKKSNVIDGVMDSSTRCFMNFFFVAAVFAFRLTQCTVVEILVLNLFFVGFVDSLKFSMYSIYNR